jgi:hypothetical protein
MSKYKNRDQLGNTYALSVLLNLARLTSILEFACLAWCRTSEPMCSPSRSQSVQMNRALADRACSLMFSAIPSIFCYVISILFSASGSAGIVHTESTDSHTGASKSVPGGHDAHPLNGRSKSRPVKCPRTLVMVTEQEPQTPPKLKLNT